MTSMQRKIVVAATGMLMPWFAFAQATLPADLKWQSNNDDKIWSSPEAKKGGTFHYWLEEFPLTMRFMGPDANGMFANYLAYGGYLPLVDRHPTTSKTIPMLASEWAYGKDNKSMYFRIDKDAKWSDGKPITADDMVKTVEIMRSKEIVDPGANDFYTTEVEKVVKYDERTFSIHAPNAKSDLDYYLGVSISVLPSHFYGKLDNDFVKNFNWKIAPVSGPYIVDKIDKGKSITMTRVKNWWGTDKRYFKNRFNVDNVRFDVIRDETMAREKFKKGEIDAFWITRPTDWHEKFTGPIFDKGYVEKVWFYNELPSGPAGLVLNLDDELFKDTNARYAFAHSLNFDLVIQKLLYNDYGRKGQYFEGFGEYTNTGIKAREFSPAKVKEYLEKSGWKRGADGIFEKGGKKFSVTLTTDQNPTLLKRLEVLKEEAKKAGVELILNAIDGADAFKAAREKKFQAFYVSMNTGVIPAPREYFHSSFAHKPQTNNFSSVDDKEIDKQLEIFQSSYDIKTRQEAVRNILKREHEICSFIGAYEVPFVREALWRWVRYPQPVVGPRTADVIATNPVHAGYGGNFWLDEDVKKETQAAMKSGKTFPAVVKIDKTWKAK